MGYFLTLFNRLKLANKIFMFAKNLKIIYLLAPALFILFFTASDVVAVGSLVTPFYENHSINAYMDLDDRIDWVFDYEHRTPWYEPTTPWQLGYAYDQHKGTDYNLAIGAKVAAGDAGTVVSVVDNQPNTYPSDPTNAGNRVSIDHSNGYRTKYFHLETGSLFVGVNEEVQQGRYIAKSDNSGYSTGPHLHFEVVRLSDNKQRDPYEDDLWTTNPPSLGVEPYFFATAWNFTQFLEGFTLNNASSTAIFSNEYWQIDPGLDPQLVSPKLGAVTASQYPTIEFSFSAQGTGEFDACQVFFSKTSPPSYNAGDVVNCNQFVIKDGTQRIYKAYLSNDPDYTGNITAVRIDPIVDGDPNSSNDLIYVDYIRFSSNTWSYEQTFNNLNNGDLNNQDSWSGATEYDVQSTLAYEGTKAVQVNALNTSKLISRTVPSFTSGQMYFSVRRDTNSVGYLGVYLRNSTAGHVAFIYFKPDGNISLYESVAQTEQVFGTYTSNMWYRIGIDYSASTDQYRVNINNGAWSPYYAAVGLTSEINQIKLYADSNANSYLDFISPNYQSSTPPPPSDITPPVISSVSSSNITPNSATITWTTDEPSTSQVEYGPTTAYGYQTSINLTLVTSHSVNLNGLSPGTLYHYRVKSKDAAGNEAISSDYTFTTVSNTWTYEQTFNTLNNGDLNGQDNWSGDIQYDVQSTLAYEGTKAVQVNALDTSKLITRTVPSFTSGQMYFSVRRDTNSVGYFGFYLRNSTAGHVAFIYLKPNGNISAYEGVAQTERIIGTYQPNTWYRIGIDYSASTDKYRANINNGAWSSWYDAVAATSEINQIKLYADSNANSYLDFISPNYSIQGAGGSSAPFSDALTTPTLPNLFITNPNQNTSTLNLIDILPDAAVNYNFFATTSATSTITIIKRP